MLLVFKCRVLVSSFDLPVLFESNQGRMCGLRQDLEGLQSDVRVCVCVCVCVCAKRARGSQASAVL